MPEPRHIPKALTMVSVLFLLGGLSSAIEMVVKLLSGGLNINSGILGIPTFFGLRRFSLGWRTYALVCIWLGLISLPIAFISGFFISLPVDFSLFGIQLGRIPPIWLSIGSIPLFLFKLWQYRVLTRPDIRALFFSSHEPMH